MESKPAIFEDFEIRRIYDEKAEVWHFSVEDIIRALLQPDFQTAQKYWNKLKERLGKEGSESVTNCHRLKLKEAGKKGGGIARKARVELEEKTGRSVVTGENFLPPGRKKISDK